MNKIYIPTIGDGLETWKKHLKDLNNLSFEAQQSSKIISAKLKTIKIINFMEDLPSGVYPDEIEAHEISHLMA